MKRIRLLKELPNAPVGSEFYVCEFADGSKFIRIQSKLLHVQRFRIPLADIQGWYEEVKEMPKEGAEFWFVTKSGFVDNGFYRKGSVFHDNILHFKVT